MSKVSVGIDLGSTESEISIIENGKPKVIPTAEGPDTFASVVALNEKEERKVGAAAKRQAIVHPKETINLVKRFMGRTWDDPETQEAIKHVRYKVVNHNGYPYIVLQGKEYSPQEISSWILSALKKQAEDYLGEEVTDAVITVPAMFPDAGRTATKEAGELAGLNVLRIINEPTAACLASNLDKSGKYMVVDFGGSTTDFSVVDFGKEDQIMEILASDGDTWLGGADLDNTVAKYIVNEFKKETGVDLSKDNMAMQRVVEAAEKAKIELSAAKETDINLPYITVVDSVPQHLVTKLTRAKFEQLIKPWVDKLMKCGHQALEKSKADKLDGIILVGGSCRIPYVQERLKEEFGVELIQKAHLDLAVAEGASIQANILAGNTSDSDLLLLDVTPLSLGIETLGGVMTKLIDANTTIPTKKSETFSTAADNQTAVTISILQGERPMAADNKLIGRFNLDGIAPAPKGIPQIEVTFDIDANGIVKVSAKDKATDKEQHITIENKSGLTQEEIDRIKADAEAHKEEDEKKKELINKVNEAESYAYSIENAIGENSPVSEEDKNNIKPKIDALKKAAEAKDPELIDKCKSELEAVWKPLVTKMYEKAKEQNKQESTEGTNTENHSEEKPNTEGTADENVTDADFEEVK